MWCHTDGPGDVRIWGLQQVCTRSLILPGLVAHDSAGLANSSKPKDVADALLLYCWGQSCCVFVPDGRCFVTQLCFHEKRHSSYQAFKGPVQWGRGGSIRQMNSSQQLYRWLQGRKRSVFKRLLFKKAVCFDSPDCYCQDTSHVCHLVCLVGEQMNYSLQEAKSWWPGL